MCFALASVAQLVGALFHKLEGHRLSYQSGHMPGLWVQSPVKLHGRGNQLMFLSHTGASLPLSPSIPLSLKSMSMSSGDKKYYVFLLQKI